MVEFNKNEKDLKLENTKESLSTILSTQGCSGWIFTVLNNHKMFSENQILNVRRLLVFCAQKALSVYGGGGFPVLQECLNCTTNAEANLGSWDDAHKASKAVLYQIEYRGPAEIQPYSTSWHMGTCIAMLPALLNSYVYAEEFVKHFCISPECEEWLKYSIRQLIDAWDV